MFRKIVLLMSVLLVMLSVSLVSALGTSSDDLVYDPQIHIYEYGMEAGIMKDHIRWGTLASLNQQILESSETNQPNSLAEKNQGFMSDLSEQTDGAVIIVPSFKGGIGITPNAVESGSWFYPPAWPWQSGDAQTPNNVRWNSCGGGDDAWVDFYYVPETDFLNNKLRTWATNAVSSTHIVQNGGLDGGYYCAGGSCTISMCSTQLYGSNPWSVYLFYLGGA